MAGRTVSRGGRGSTCMIESRRRPSACRAMTGITLRQCADVSGRLDLGIDAQISTTMAG